jgi:hypothetical protein
VGEEGGRESVIRSEDQISGEAEAFAKTAAVKERRFGVGLIGGKAIPKGGGGEVVEGGKAFAVKELGGGIAGFSGRKERSKGGTERERVGKMEEKKQKKRDM